jgi:hypothetical protein
MKRFQTRLPAVTLFVVALLFWILSDISTWLVVDSYALFEFPKAYPFLGALVQFVWVADTFGGRYVVIALLLILWWLTVRPQKRGRDDA